MVGAGVLPNVELASDAGLEVGNGISVDDKLRTSDPRIFAIGDCAEFPCVFTGTRLRLESVQNAADQARCVAANLLGRDQTYSTVPWFWTDQFGVKLQMAGLSSGADGTVLRGIEESGEFSLFYFRAERLIAVDSINRPADHMAARKLLAAATPVSPDQVADLSFDSRRAA